MAEEATNDLLHAQLRLVTANAGSCGTTWYAAARAVYTARPGVREVYDAIEARWLTHPILPDSVELLLAAIGAFGSPEGLRELTDQDVLRIIRALGAHLGIDLSPQRLT